MKRQLSLLLAMACFCIAGYAQTNGSFENLTGTNHGFAFSAGQVVGWKQSHGTPSITGGAPGQGNRSAWMWSYSGKGEGIVQAYSFAAGRTYTVSFWVRTNNPDGQFYVKAANGVPNGTSSSIPSVSSQKTIYSAGLVFPNWTKRTITFTATSNYSQLWIYPQLNSYPNNGQAELMIDGISISTCTPVSVYVPNYSFESLTGTNHGFAFSAGQVTGWKQSHGTPSISGGATGQGSRSAWMWSYSGKGEGIVTNVGLQSGKTYKIRFWVRTNNPDGQFYVKIANNVPSGTSTSSTIPSVSSQQTLYASGLNLSNWTEKTITFRANNNYSQLWIYPQLNSYPSNGQAELMVDGIRLETVCNKKPVIWPLPIKDIKELKVAVYPNPTTERISVALPTETKEVTITLYDLISGRKVGTFKATQIDNEWSIPEHIKGGLYQMVITDAEHNATKSMRLVVNRK